MIKRDLNLAVIGNCIIGALIDRAGRHVWSCFPRLDADPIFCNLLKNGDPVREDGFFEITVENLAKCEQSYLANTAILITVLTDSQGNALRILDFAPRFKQYERIFRPTMLIRRVEPLAGRCRIRVKLRPAFDYGALTPTRTLGSNHIRYTTPAGAIRLSTDAPISYIAEESAFVLDEPLNFIVGPDETFPGSINGIARDFLERTEDYWREWSRYLSVPFEWQDAVIRAAITLKLCSFEETGAIIAAMTTSIPEEPGTGRTWDYRYCWLRDAYFVVHALNRLGATRTMEEYIRYITNVAALDPGGSLRPVYAILPDEPLDERIIPSLPGYRDMGPVRVGNGAWSQVQNDSYGSIVLAAAQMFFDQRLPRMGDIELFHRLEKLGEQAVAVAFAPDAGLWEFRTKARVHTHSAVMCWAAANRLSMIARRVGQSERTAYWNGQADRIRRDVFARAWNPQIGSFVETFDGGEVDASLLLLAEIGFVRPDDPRYLGTVAAIEQRLKRGRHLLRYNGADDFGAPTMSFTVCTFWYIEALAAIGRREEARDIFEHMLASRNHVGLLSEDLDPATGELWGNFPQSYSMVGLILSAMRLSKSWEESVWRVS